VSTSSADSIFNVGSTNVVVPVGATVAVYISPVAGQNTTLFKYFAGGTLQVIGVPYGVTLTGAQLVSAVANHYIMGGSEILSFNGPLTCYLQAMGATTTVMMLRGQTQGP
jgi:hypothetical protein